MSKLGWLDSMSVGVDEFDDDHRNFVETLARIADELRHERPAAARLLCEVLINQTRNHCEREEAFLRSIDFPTTEAVLAVQKRSLANLRALADAIADSPTEAAKTIAGMQAALIDYLMHADINYKSFVDSLASKGRKG